MSSSPSWQPPPQPPPSGPPRAGAASEETGEGASRRATSAAAPPPPGQRPDPSPSFPSLAPSNMPVQIHSGDPPASGGSASLQLPEIDLPNVAATLQPEQIALLQRRQQQPFWDPQPPPEGLPRGPSTNTLPPAHRVSSAAAMLAKLASVQQKGGTSSSPRWPSVLSRPPLSTNPSTTTMRGGSAPLDPLAPIPLQALPQSSASVLPSLEHRAQSFPSSLPMSEQPNSPLVNSQIPPAHGSTLESSRTTGTKRKSSVTALINLLNKNIPSNPSKRRALDVNGVPSPSPSAASPTAASDHGSPAGGLLSLQLPPTPTFTQATNAQEPDANDDAASLDDILAAAAAASVATSNDTPSPGLAPKLSPALSTLDVRRPVSPPPWLRNLTPQDALVISSSSSEAGDNQDAPIVTDVVRPKSSAAVKPEAPSPPLSAAIAPPLSGATEIVDDKADDSGTTLLAAAPVDSDGEDSDAPLASFPRGEAEQREASGITTRSAQKRKQPASSADDSDDEPDDREDDDFEGDDDDDDEAPLATRRRQQPARQATRAQPVRRSPRGASHEQESASTSKAADTESGYNSEQSEYPRGRPLSKRTRRQAGRLPSTFSTDGDDDKSTRGPRSPDATTDPQSERSPSPPVTRGQRGRKRIGRLPSASSTDHEGDASSEPQPAARTRSARIEKKGRAATKRSLPDDDEEEEADEDEKEEEEVLLAAKAAAQLKDQQAIVTQQVQQILSSRLASASSSSSVKAGAPSAPPPKPLPPRITTGTARMNFEKIIGDQMIYRNVDMVVPKVVQVFKDLDDTGVHVGEESLPRFFSKLAKAASPAGMRALLDNAYFMSKLVGWLEMLLPPPMRRASQRGKAATMTPQQRLKMQEQGEGAASMPRTLMASVELLNKLPLTVQELDGPHNLRGLLSDLSELTNSKYAKDLKQIVRKYAIQPSAPSTSTTPASTATKATTPSVSAAATPAVNAATKTTGAKSRMEAAAAASAKPAVKGQAFPIVATANAGKTQASTSGSSAKLDKGKHKATAPSTTSTTARKAQTVDPRGQGSNGAASSSSGPRLQSVQKDPTFFGARANKSKVPSKGDASSVARPKPKVSSSSIVTSLYANPTGRAPAPTEAATTPERKKVRFKEDPALTQVRHIPLFDYMLDESKILLFHPEMQALVIADIQKRAADPEGTVLESEETGEGVALHRAHDYQKPDGELDLETEVEERPWERPLPIEFQGDMEGEEADGEGDEAHVLLGSESLMRWEELEEWEREAGNRPSPIIVPAEPVEMILPSFLSSLDADTTQEDLDTTQEDHDVAQEHDPAQASQDVSGDETGEVETLENVIADAVLAEKGQNAAIDLSDETATPNVEDSTGIAPQEDPQEVATIQLAQAQEERAVSTTPSAEGSDDMEISDDAEQAPDPRVSPSQNTADMDQRQSRDPEDGHPEVFFPGPPPSLQVGPSQKAGHNGVVDPRVGDAGSAFGQELDAPSADGRAGASDADASTITVENAGTHDGEAFDLGASTHLDEDFSHLADFDDLEGLEPDPLLSPVLHGSEGEEGEGEEDGDVERSSIEGSCGSADPPTSRPGAARTAARKTLYLGAPIKADVGIAREKKPTPWTNRPKTSGIHALARERRISQGRERDRYGGLPPPNRGQTAPARGGAGTPRAGPSRSAGLNAPGDDEDDEEDVGESDGGRPSPRPPASSW